jgi:hypothetical protein
MLSQGENARGYAYYKVSCHKLITCSSSVKQKKINASISSRDSWQIVVANPLSEACGPFAVAKPKEEKKDTLGETQSCVEDRHRHSDRYVYNEL